MADVEIPGVSEDALLAKYRALSGNPTASVDDMFGFVMGPHTTSADVVTLIGQNAATAYVGGSNKTPLTISGLMAAYPASAFTVGMYARVSDLYGTVDEIMRCRYDGANYRWVPQREAYSGVATAATGTINILPLITPPTLRATATLTGNVQFVASAVNAYIGQRQRVVMAGTLGLFTATITGLIGSNIALLGGNSKTIEYGSTGWFSAD